MYKKKTSAQLISIHEESMADFEAVQSVLWPERQQCLEDRRFASIAGAQWEGQWCEHFANKPRLENNKVQLALTRIFNEYRNNRVTVDYVSKDGAKSDDLADLCDGLYRAAEQNCNAKEAYDNAFDEGASGGYGAWRLRSVSEDEYDDENEKQKLVIEPIYDADLRVWFDIGCKRQDKKDAKRCWVLTPVQRSQYEEEWGDSPSSWPQALPYRSFDWATPDVVYISESYVVESVKEKLHTYEHVDGSIEEFKTSDFEGDEDLKERLIAVGARETKARNIKCRRIHKYIESGGKILEDCGYIAGDRIPVVVFYGKRWFVENIERCSGVARYQKDSQRLDNMMVSKLAEISALSSVEKPILFAEQIVGHQQMWASDNVNNYSHLIINPIKDSSGQLIYQTPTAYTRSPSVPPALAALYQITQANMQEMSGNQGEADKMVSNISGKAVEMIQQRIDGQAYIYMDNFAKAMQLSGEIALGIMREIYVEKGRKLKAVGRFGDVQSVEINKPTMVDGEMGYENDLYDANFDVVTSVGPSSSSKRSSTVRALTAMLSITQDPESRQLLEISSLMNMELEGADWIQEYARKKLVKMGLQKPTDEDIKEMQEAQSNQDPNAVYLQAAAKEAEAKAKKAEADTIKTIADAERIRAQTIQTLSDVDIEEQKHAVEVARAIGGALNEIPSEQIPADLAEVAVVQPQELDQYGGVE